VGIGILVFVGIRLWFIDGLLRRVMIDGPSMALAFCGAHYDVRCGDCGFPFRCDAEHVPSDGKAVCPNCGFTENMLADARLMPSDRVLIDRWPLLFRQPKRGEVVAIKVPGDSGDFAVKRIAAIPGECLSIRGGDLFVYDLIIRKSPAELHALHVLVHDNGYQPQKTKGLPPRWRGATENSKWKPVGNGFQIDASGSVDACDWLEYEHWPCTANPRLRGVVSPITDNDGYNQGELKRPLNSVRDVMLSCQLQAVGPGRVVLAAVDGNQRFELLLLSTNPSVLLLNGHQLLVVPIDLSRFAKGAQTEFGLCDQQILLIVDGKTIICNPYDRRTAVESEAPHPVAIGSIGAGLQINDLKVWRDVYYLGPSGLGRDWRAGRTLGPDEFMLLGDNQPVSIDSRQWEPGAVLRKANLGLVR
jgi:hypothetical protein